MVAYVDALRAQASTATLRKQMALARQLHTITVDRLEQGVASRLDERRALQQTHNLQQLLLEAEAAVTTAKLQLSAVIHAQPTADYELADVHMFYDTGSLDAGQAVGMALTSRPDARAAAARLRAAETDQKAAQAISLPRVSFYADYGQSGNQMYANLNTYTVRGDVGVPIYFGGRATAERQRAGRSRCGGGGARAVQAMIETEALAGAAQVDSARRQVEVAVEAVALAEEEIDLTTTRFTSEWRTTPSCWRPRPRRARREPHSSPAGSIWPRRVASRDGAAEQRTELKPLRNRTLTASFALLALLTGGCDQRARSRAEGPLRIVGRVEGDQTSVAAKAPGRVLEVSVREGDMVRPGQTLLQIEATQVAARREQAAAGLRAAQQEAEAVRLRLPTLEQRLRQVEIQKQQAELDAAGRVAAGEGQWAAAQADLARAEAELEQARSDAKRFRVLADKGAAPEQIAEQLASKVKGAEAVVEAARRQVRGAGALDVAKAARSNPELLEAEEKALRRQMDEVSGAVRVAEEGVGAARALLGRLRRTWRTAVRRRSRVWW